MHASHAISAPLRPLRVGTRARIMLLGVGFLLIVCCGSGIGATSASSTVTVTTGVADTISLVEPAALDATPAPTVGATWTPGAPSAINLGELQGSVVRSASATWKVSTNAVNGYSLVVANAGAAPVMKSGANTYPDMCAIGAGCPATFSTAQSAFGIAAGNAVTHAQGSTPPMWGTSGGGGTQGTLFAGIPVGGVVIGQRAAAINNDPVTINFAAVSNTNNLRPPGTYSGLITLTATSL